MARVNPPSKTAASTKAAKTFPAKKETAPAAPAAPASVAPVVAPVAPQVTESRPVSQNAPVRNQAAEDLIDYNQGVVTFDETNEQVEVGVGGLELDPKMGRLDECYKELAFNEEILTVNIATTTDVNAEKYVFLAVNGKGPGPGGYPYVPRGVDLKMARKYVGVLCRARPEAYDNVEKVNARTGEYEVEYPKTSGLKYPFAVVHDPNPLGQTWLKAMLSGRVR